MINEQKQPGPNGSERQSMERENLNEINSAKYVFD